MNARERCAYKVQSYGNTSVKYSTGARNSQVCSLREGNPVNVLLLKCKVGFVSYIHQVRVNLTIFSRCAEPVEVRMEGKDVMK